MYVPAGIYMVFFLSEEPTILPISQFLILNSQFPQFPQFPLYTVRRGLGTLFRPYK